MAGDLTSQELIDPFGRLIEDLRISITDRCNFRCTYCMPEEGMQWLPRSDVMRFEEIERLARIFVERYGVRGIRLTGGEPTGRAHLPVLGAKLAAIEGPHGKVDLAMTTNGATMRLVADTLRESGLRRVNISLDTLDRAKFLQMTRRDELERVLDGIEAAKDAGFDPVKINAVIERGVNDDEIVALDPE
jgi:cyclic pyranopterin phosphate synthase